MGFRNGTNGETDTRIRKEVNCVDKFRENQTDLENRFKLSDSPSQTWSKNSFHYNRSSDRQ